MSRSWSKIRTEISPNRLLSDGEKKKDHKDTKITKNFMLLIFVIFVSLWSFFCRLHIQHVHKFLNGSGRFLQGGPLFRGEIYLDYLLEAASSQLYRHTDKEVA